MSEKQTAGLLISSIYLLGKGDEVRDNLKQVLAPSLQKFAADQARSALDSLQRVSRIAGPAGELQEQLIANTSRLLGFIAVVNGRWS